MKYCFFSKTTQMMKKPLSQRGGVGVGFLQMKIICILWLLLAALSPVLAQSGKPAAKTKSAANAAQTGRPVMAPATKAAPAPPGGNVPTFRLLAKNKQDSVILRWQASSEILWKVASRTGYTVERYTIAADSANRWAKKTWTIKPWTEAEWHQKLPTDTAGMVLATLALGKETAITEKTTLYGLLLKKHENDTRFMLATLLASYNPRQAQIMGYRLVDNTVERNKKYLYRVYAPTAPFKLKSDTALVYVETGSPDPDPTLAPLMKEEQDRRVRIKWNRKYADTYFVSYYPERSDDGGRTFRRLTTKPFFQVFSGAEKEDADKYVFADSLAVNYKPHQYRLRGITAFGELTAPSPVLIAMGRDRTPPTSVTNLKAVNTTGSTVRLTWAKAQKEGDLAGYIVSKGNDLDGPFKPLTDKLLTPTTMQFDDATANEFSRNFYVVTAVDTAGNAAATQPAYVAMLDRAAPAKPTGLTGTIDSIGRVTINWQPNAEPDLLGYFVYSANAPDHAFTPLTPDFLADEQFSDSITLRTLSEKIYYRVVAFDKSRRASPYSEILELKKPDRIRPVSPVFDRFLVADSSVTLHWARSSSEDVVAQWLYRKEEGKDADYVLLTKFDKAKTEYIDRTVLPRHGYSYGLVAVDDSRNQSGRSFPQRVRTFDAGIRPGTKNLSATAPPDKPVQLQWKMPITTGGRILVYRKINDQPLRLIDNLPGSQQTYLDASAQKGTYQYALKTVYSDGGESPLSAFVRVDR